jgi:hypothetical protein
LINFCWFFFKWGLVVCAIGAVAAVPYFYRRVDEEIRHRIEALFAQHYTGLKPTVGSAELVAGQGIRVRDISIVEPGAEGPRAKLAYVEEMFIACQTDVKELICRDPVVTHVTLRRPTIWVTRRPDGTWSAAKLFPPPRFGNQSPEVTIENGTIEIFDPLKPRASTLILRDLNMTVSPAILSSSDPGAAPKRNLQGMFAGDNFQRVEFRGSIDAFGPDFSLSGEVEGLRVSPELHESLPGPIADKLAALRKLRAEGQMSFSLAYDSKAPAPLRFHVAGQLTGGRIDDQQLPLPHPLTDLQIKFAADNGGVVIDKLTASCNQAKLKMSLRHTGFDANKPLWLHAEIKQLELDRQLLGVLPGPLQEQWRKYLPIGVIDADLTLEFDGQTWRPETSEALFSFSNISFTYYKFPYRVDHGKGSLELKNDLLTLDVTAYGGTQPIRMKAEIVRPLSGWTGWFEAKGDDIQMDKAVIQALRDDKTREVVQSLDPRGTVNFEYRCRRDVPDQPILHHLKLNANGCSIRYAKFPYPINNIRGQLEMIDHSWTFRNLQGMNDSARITGDGELMPSLKGNKFVLNLVANNVPLDRELHDALAPNIQQAWNDLKPQGMVDLSAQICYLSEQKQLSLGVRVEPKSETASIEPVHFPYRMDKLQGVLLYCDGHVTLQHFEAWHGPVKILTEGFCDFLPDGGWNLHLAGLTVDRLHPDRDLILALPERLKKAVLTLNPAGPINLCGNLDLFHDGRQGRPLRSQWDDVRINMFQSAMQCGVKLDNISGTATLSGQFDGQIFFCRGELNIESLIYKDCQFKHVMGPIWIDDQRVLLGSLVDKAADGSPLLNADGTPRTPRSISANLFGGIIYGDGQVSLGAEPRYHLNAVLAHADLASLAREVIDGKQHMQGKIMANVELHGVGTSRNALSGRGSLALSDADIYELPVMISLLKILSIRAPDRNAFSTASMDYQIKGEHIYLDRIDFNGDAISLHGNGEMDFQSNINLSFDTTVGRGELDLPIIKQIYRGASQQILQIHVGRTLQNPEIRKEPFPAVNQALQQLQGAKQQ